VFNHFDYNAKSTLIVIVLARMSTLEGYRGSSRKYWNSVFKPVSSKQLDGWFHAKHRCFHLRATTVTR
jgi:hypothetical protein